MLPKNRRVGKDLVVEVLKRGNVYHSPFFVLKTLQSEDLSKQSRFAFIVSKKVANTAVLRNKLKRWGSVSVEGVLDRVLPAYLAVFSFKKGGDKEDFKSVQTDIQALLVKSGILVEVTS